MFLSTVTALIKGMNTFKETDHSHGDGGVFTTKQHGTQEKLEQPTSRTGQPYQTVALYFDDEGYAERSQRSPSASVGRQMTTAPGLV